MAGKKQLPPEKKPGGGGGPGFGGEGGEEKAERTDAMKMVKKAEQALGKVNVVYGAHDLDMDLAGLSVAEIQLALRDVLNVDENVEAYVDGKMVENKGSFKLKKGQRLEFMKEAGQKG
jgi:hypothetical protein